MRRPLAMIALGATLAATGCSDSGTPAADSQRDPSQLARTPEDAPPSKPATPVEASPEELAERGRQTYLSSCIACHNADPTQEGALGPAVSGSSRELLEARVIRGVYPEGYVPKRETAVMVAMPFLENQIPALAAYLQAAAR